MESKKNSYFNKVEDKYVFRVSTAFWHLLIGLISLAAIIGIAVFVWSLIPSSRQTITSSPLPSKPNFPAVEKVNLSDLNFGDEKAQPISVPLNQPIYQAKPQVINEYDPDKPAYDVSLSELKRIVPPGQWEPRVLKISNQLGWDLYHSEPYGWWVSNGRTVEDNLENIYRNLKLKKYSEKKKAIDSFIKIANSVPEDYKAKVIEDISMSINSNWSNLKILDSLSSSLANEIRTFNGIKHSEAIHNLISFSFNTPQNIFDFIPFASKACIEFPDSSRTEALNVIISAYYNYFNNNVEVQKDATKQFIDLMPMIRGVNRAFALRKFYSVYNRKNQKRNEHIAQLLNEYNSQISVIIADSTMRAQNEEGKYRISQMAKSELRWRAAYAVGGGFIAIALLGTVLTLLSIQRILKKLEVTSDNRQG